VLQDLIEEDDRVIETWYLFAMCLHAGGEHGDASDAVERGQALAKALGMPPDDPLVLAFADTKVPQVLVQDMVVGCGGCGECCAMPLWAKYYLNDRIDVVCYGWACLDIAFMMHAAAAAAAGCWMM